MPAASSSPPATDPVLLALDTATDRLHIALSVPAQHRAEAQVLPGGAQASAGLLPALQGLLSAAGLTWRDVSAIALGAGPGAFTGLRTACSVTQGLALGLGVPVLVLDTLMAVAEDARQRAAEPLPPGAVVWVLQDARMGELYVGAFTWDGARWAPLVPPALWSLGELRSRWGGRAQAVRVCGNALVACPAAWDGLQADDIEVLAPEAAPAGLALLALAAQAWARGEQLDPALALPRYVRDKVAQTTAERAAAQA
jgi:tRNA threonylcarbamoyladenosine biosynthesis protein TsaB